jgi:hypothetical protein
METVNLKEKFSRFSDYCNPRIIGEVNDCQVKAVKLNINSFCTITKKDISCFWWSEERCA